MRNLLTVVILFAFATINLHATEPTKENVTKLYIATFDRAPDKAGLEYWVNDSKLNLENIAMSFFDQPETKSLYPTETSTEDFIKFIYANLFKRSPDSEGATYWKKDLDSGVVNKSVFILAIVNGAKGDDATLLANKTEVGLKFVESGSNDVAKAKSIMSKITKSDDSVNDALALIASFGSKDEEEEAKEVETPDLSINTNTGTSTATGSTTTTPSSSTSTTTGGSTTSETTTTSDDESEGSTTTTETTPEVIDDHELLPTF